MLDIEPILPIGDGLGTLRNIAESALRERSQDSKQGHNRDDGRNKRDYGPEQAVLQKGLHQLIERNHSCFSPDRS